MADDIVTLYLFTICTVEGITRRSTGFFFSAIDEYSGWWWFIWQQRLKVTTSIWQ